MVMILTILLGAMRAAMPPGVRGVRLFLVIIAGNQRSPLVRADRSRRVSASAAATQSGAASDAP